MPYISYCNKCQNNKCMLCEQEHDDSHEIIYFGKKLPKINDVLIYNGDDVKIGKLVEGLKNGNHRKVVKDIERLFNN